MDELLKALREWELQAEKAGAELTAALSEIQRIRRLIQDLRYDRMREQDNFGQNIG